MTKEIIDFSETKKRLDAKKTDVTVTNKEPTDDEIVVDSLKNALNLTIDAINAGGRGLISIVISDEDMPHVIVAGELDPFRSTGILEMVKIEMLNQMAWSGEQDLEDEDDPLYT